jgi:hypothetical protein
MFRIFTLILLMASSAAASTGIAVEATPDAKFFAELSIVGLISEGDVEVYDALTVQPEKRPRLTVVFDRINTRLRVRLIDEDARVLLGQFELVDTPGNAHILRTQARLMARQILAAAEPTGLQTVSRR